MRSARNNMTLRQKTKRAPSIRKGRPPFLNAKSASLTSRAIRSVIRSHHGLQKQRAKAIKEGDHVRAQELETTINARGGIHGYQLASKIGQSSDRGGDTSKLLVDWLNAAFNESNANQTRLRMLEIGALSTDNACSHVGCLDVTRIDLKSREAGIQEIDFMELPIPLSEDGKYHVISLSLVLNFVPDAASRGSMLRRIPQFLHPSATINGCPFPYLFLVLPLPCVSNSRYLTEARLEEIMGSLGFNLTKTKKTSKLFYSLWRHENIKSMGILSFKKKQMRSGASRNNFAIVLD